MSTEPETEIIDKLFLELSQFTRAKTHKQIKLEAQVKRRGKLIEDIFNTVELPPDLSQRASDELMGFADRARAPNGDQDTIVPAPAPHKRPPPGAKS